LADARRAIESGLISAEWYRGEVPGKVMKHPMTRSDQPAIPDTISLCGLMAVFSGTAIVDVPMLLRGAMWGPASARMGFGRARTSISPMGL
jgi:hypothetical protein